MFYEYFYAKAVELEKMQMDFYIRTGIAWNDNLFKEIDNEGSVELLVNKPSIRMYILMLDTRNEEQTNDVHMYIEEYLF